MGRENEISIETLGFRCVDEIVCEEVDGIAGLGLHTSYGSMWMLFSEPTPRMMMDVGLTSTHGT